jgi:hypothetical protein
VLYATIWVALTLFAASETAKRSARAGRLRPSVALTLALSGAVLCALHMAVAIVLHHGGSHAAAVLATALQTQSVYGLNWGGGVYVNYLFLGVWIADAWSWWHRFPRAYPPRVAFVLRGFYLVILANAAVVFASPSRRLVGLALIGWLLWAWRPADTLGSRATDHVSPG